MRKSRSLSPSSSPSPGAVSRSAPCARHSQRYRLRHSSPRRRALVGQRPFLLDEAGIPSQLGLVLVLLGRRFRLLGGRYRPRTVVGVGEAVEQLRLSLLVQAREPLPLAGARGG